MLIFFQTTARAGVSFNELSILSLWNVSYPAKKFSSIGRGIHVVMNAKTALELGAPIRGILAFDSTPTSVFLQTQSFSSATKPEEGR
jgi:hypothetical protein